MMVVLGTRCLALAAELLQDAALTAEQAATAAAAPANDSDLLRCRRIPPQP
jgi:hypothetical protein